MRHSNSSDADEYVTGRDDQLLPGIIFRLPITREHVNLPPTFADSTHSEMFPRAIDQPPPDPNFATSFFPMLTQSCTRRHNKTVNVVFLDGHVENFKILQLWSLDWNAQWVSPQFMQRINW